jgi:hypothetical protein
MGASIDDSGLSAAGRSAIPAFFAMGGFGAGLFGFDLGVFVNSATGRYRAPNQPIDRLDIDAMMIVRPAAGFDRGDGRYGLRVLRTLGLDVGFGYEHAARIVRAPEQLSRVGLRVGAQIDLPLTAAAEAGAPGGELRLRLAVRRLFAHALSTFPEGDAPSDTSGELFAALVAVF